MTAPIPWQQMTHQQLDAAVRAGPGPGASMAAEQLWRRVSEIVEAGEARMYSAASRSGDSWQGGAGDAARSGLHQLNSWARDAATDAQNTVSAMLDQGVSAGRLRASMPAPNTEQLETARGTAVLFPFDPNVQQALTDAEGEAVWREESARRAMEGYYFHSADNRRLMDFWTVPPTVVVDGAQVGAGGGGSGSGGSGFVASSGLGSASVPVDGAVAGGPVAGGSTAGGSPAGATGAGGTGAGGTGAGGTGAGAPGIGSVGAGPVAAPGPATVSPRGPGASPPGGSAIGGSAGGGSGGGVPGGGVPGVRGGPASGGTGGAAPVGSIRRPPPTPAIRGRADLPAGAGGRGPRPVTGTAPPSTGGVRPVVPRVPSPPAPSPTWRDVVAGHGGGPGGRAPDPGSRGGIPGVPPRAGTLVSPVEPAARSTGSSHGMYPPMAGTGGAGAGEGRRRASFLIDDSGAFDVDVPYTDPVIGEEESCAGRSRAASPVRGVP